VLSASRKEKRTNELISTSAQYYQVGKYHEQVVNKKNKPISPPSDLRLFSSENCLTIFFPVKAGAG
jgi:hypothetical protein